MPKLDFRGVRWWAVLLLAGLTWLALYGALRRIRVEADIFSALPASSPALNSSRKLLQQNVLTDRIAVDVQLRETGKPRGELFAVADAVAEEMRQSGLFASVGHEAAAEALLELNRRLPEHLPVLFTRQELESDVAPLVQPQAIRQALEQRLAELSELEGTGSAALLSADPLQLRFLVMKRLGALTLGSDAQIESGHLVSPDGRHVLLTAESRSSISDGEQNQRLAAFFANLTQRWGEGSPSGVAAELNVVGAYRAALDNEAIVKADTNRALWVATIGIALLLLLFFARPILGVLSLLPATTGVALGLLEMSLFDRDISALSLGFGAALVSITVDQGIMFASFLDRFRDRSGWNVAAAIFAPGLVATVSTAGAFLSLRWSGFELLGELGTFAALSVVSAFAVVQLVFPLIVRTQAGGASSPLVSLSGLLRRMCVGRRGRVAALMGALAVILFAVARPEFRVDLRAMSTVSASTEAAEAVVASTWGDVMASAYVYVSGSDLEQLRRRTDALVLELEDAHRDGRVGSWFLPSLVTPGRELAARRAQDWVAFWTPERRRKVSHELIRTGEELGFTRDAFAPFLASLSEPPQLDVPVPDALLPVLGVNHRRDGHYDLVVPIERGPAYDAEHLATQLATAGAVIHDGSHLAELMNSFLHSAFLRMVLIIGGFVFVCVVLAFHEPWLVLAVMTPVGFGLLVTLGVLGLIHHPLDVSGMLLAIIVFGMGIDFSLHLVKSHQRHPADDHPEHEAVRAATLLECTATVIGMGSLVLAQHSTARSAGVVGLVGIASCGVGAFLFLPPILRRLFQDLAPDWSADPARPGRRAFRRYRFLPSKHRAFAWFKLRLDPMFARLERVGGGRQRVLDVGCGVGLPSTWLLAASDERFVVATEPDSRRAAVAALVLGARGRVHELAAPELPDRVDRFDLALLLDVAHYLDDESLRATLARVRDRLDEHAVLLMRHPVPLRMRPSWLRSVEDWRLRSRGVQAQFRAPEAIERIVTEAGFDAELELESAREEVWVIARPRLVGMG